MRRNPESRVLGPYRERGGFRLVIREGGGRTTRKVATEAQARAIKAALEKELEKAKAQSTSFVLAAYEQHLHDKGNKPSSVSGTIGKLRCVLLHVVEITQLTPKRAAALYHRLRTQPSSRTGRPLSPDSHRNILAECKTFGRWCTKSKFLPANPFAEIEGTGRRSHGKPQLRIDEARSWCAVALDLAESGDDGAVAALMTLLLGLRAGEVVARVVRDVDDRGRLLWIPDSKTLAGRRQVEIPPVLQGHIHRLVSGRKATEPIFGDHWRDWPRKQVQRICKLARVPTVCAHSMRGLHSTLAIQAGASSHLVAASLGHETPDITRRSYVRPGTLEAQHATQAQARLADVIPMHGNFRVRNRSPTVPQPFHGPPTEITNQDSPPGFVWS